MNFYINETWDVFCLMSPLILQAYIRRLARVQAAYCGVRLMWVHLRFHRRWLSCLFVREVTNNCQTVFLLGGSLGTCVDYLVGTIRFWVLTVEKFFLANLGWNVMSGRFLIMAIIGCLFDCEISFHSTMRSLLPWRNGFQLPSFVSVSAGTRGGSKYKANPLIYHWLP